MLDLLRGYFAYGKCSHLNDTRHRPPLHQRLGMYAMLSGAMGLVAMGCPVSYRGNLQILTVRLLYCDPCHVLFCTELSVAFPGKNKRRRDGYNLKSNDHDHFPYRQ